VGSAALSAGCSDGASDLPDLGANTGGTSAMNRGGSGNPSASGAAGASSQGGRTTTTGGVASAGSVAGGAANSGGVPTANGGNGAGTAGRLAGGAGSTTGGRAASTGGRAGVGGADHTGGAAGATGGATGGRSTGGSAAGGRSTGGDGGSSAGSAGTLPGGGELLVPDSGALLGLYYGDASIAATATKLGRALPLHLTYYAWSDDFTRAETAKDLAAGRIPFVNWELYEGGDLDDIIAGEYDDMIAERAADTKALGEPLFIDFGAEMNGDWSPWGGAQNGESAAKYLAVYRKVHDAFSKAGANNAIWAFCPNVTDEPNESWNQALNYYPGDDYVDWMCVDGYNWGNTNGGSWQSFERVFQNIYPKLAAKNKPIMIGEMASAESGGDKAAWIDAMIPTLQTKYPQIRGVLWFDVDKETDWRVSSSTGAEAAFKRMANDAYFNP
jgi:hypothetical protein